MYVGLGYIHQVLEPIKEDEMPYNPSGKFIMNPEAPVFLSCRGGHGPHPGTLLMS